MGIPKEDRRLFKRMASSRNGLAVYEADDSYAGMLAVRRRADRTFGRSWGGVREHA